MLNNEEQRDLKVSDRFTVTYWILNKEISNNQEPE